MNQDSVGWNDSLVSQLFNKEDIQAIKKHLLALWTYLIEWCGGLSQKMVSIQ